MKLLTFFWRAVLSVILFASAFGYPNFVFAQTKDVEQDSAVAKFEAGQNAHQRGDLIAAIQFYEKAIQLHAEFPEAEFQLGAALEGLGQLDQAEQALRRAAALRPDWPLPLAQLGKVLLKANKLDEAKIFLRKALDLDPNDNLIRVALIEAYLRAKAPGPFLRELLAETSKTMSTQKEISVELWTARAALERLLGDLTAAQASITQALTIEPNNIGARLERVEHSLQNRNFGLALDDLKLVLTKHPNDVSAQFLLARVYAENNNAKGALSVLETLKMRSKNLPQIAELRNEILINQTDEANGNISQLEQILASDAKNVLALSKLCRLMRTANPQKALQYCQRASEIEPTNAAHAVGFGAALVQVRRFDDAIAILNQALKAEPDNYAARANLATALYETRRYVQAITEFNSLLKEQSNSAATYFFLATAHDMLANYPEAMAAYEKFLALADSKQNQLEIDKTNLRLPILKRQVEKGAGKKKPRT